MKNSAFIVILIFQLVEAVEAVRNELLTEKQLSEKSQKEMEEDLIKTKHR